MHHEMNDLFDWWLFLIWDGEITFLIAHQQFVWMPVKINTTTAKITTCSLSLPPSPHQCDVRGLALDHNPEETIVSLLF